MQVYFRLEELAMPCVVETGKERKGRREGQCPDTGGMGREFHASDREKIQKVRYCEPLQPIHGLPSPSCLW